MKIRTAILVIFICLLGCVLYGQEDSNAQDQTIIELVLNLDEASSSAKREEIAAQIGQFGIRALGVIKRPPKGLNSQTLLTLQRIRTDIENKQIRLSAESTRVTVQGDYDLNSALKSVSSQTGYPFKNKSGERQKKRVDLTNVEFWKALDSLLDRFDANLESKSSDRQLIVNSSTDRKRKSSQVGYSGPVRVEVTDYLPTRNAANPNRSFDRFTITLEWEPKISPYEIVFEKSDITMLLDGKEPRKAHGVGSIRLPVNSGEFSKSLDLEFGPVSPDTQTIKALTGSFQLKAGLNRRAFLFSNILKTRVQSKRYADMTVKLLNVTEAEDSIVQVTVQFQINKPGDALDSHQGWMFQNEVLLASENGETSKPVRIRTTMQKNDKMELIYSFKRPGDAKKLNFKYVTPTSVRSLPVRWKLGPFQLDGLSKNPK